MLNIKKCKGQFAKKAKSNGTKKLKPGKIQKFSSSSDSDSDDETSKNETNPKEQTFPENNSLNKFVQLTNKMKCLINDSSLSINEDSDTEKVKESDNKDVGINSSFDSDDPRLVIHEDSSNDLKGVQNYMKEFLESKSSESVNSKSNVDIPGAKSSSQDKLLEEENEKRKNDKDIQTKKDFIENLIADSSESESEVEGTQEIVNTTNRNKGIKNKKSNVITDELEFDHEKTQKTVMTGGFKKDVQTKKDVIENPDTNVSESESEILGTQETAKINSNNKKKIYNNKGIKTKKSNVTADESESDHEETQKTVMTERLKKGVLIKNVQTKKDVTKNPIADISESKSKIEETQVIINTSNHKAVFTNVDSKAKKSNFITDESGSDDEEKQKTVMIGDFEKNAKSKKRNLNADIEETQEVVKRRKLNEGNSSNEEKELQSSNSEKSKRSNLTLKNESIVRKNGLNLHRKTPSPVARERSDLKLEIKEEEGSSTDSAEEEDLNEIPMNFTRTKYMPTQEEKLKLHNMTVKMRHPVLPQHKIEHTAGTRTLKMNEKELFEQYVTLKRGTFSTAEDKTIKKNWKIFCTDNEWDPKNPKPFLFMKHKNKEFLLTQRDRKRFIQCLAHGLPDRCLYSVFQRFKILFDPHRTCRYTDEEDAKIRNFIATYKAKKKEVSKKDRHFAELAAILKRTRASVWRRYRVLQKKSTKESEDAFCHSKASMSASKNRRKY